MNTSIGTSAIYFIDLRVSQYIFHSRMRESRGRTMLSGGNRKQKKAARPGEITEAAFREFTEKGYELTKMDHVADRLGVTKGTVYFYFPSKEALFEAAINARLDLAIGELKDYLAELEGTPTQRLQSYLAFIYRQIGQDPDSGPLLGLLIKEGPRFPHLMTRAHTELIGPTLAGCQAILEEGVRAGEFRPGASGPYAAEAILSPGLWLSVASLLLMPHTTEAVRDMLKTNTNLMLTGVLRD